MASRITANLNEEEFLVLSYYGDMKPHVMFHQFMLVKAIYHRMNDKKFTKILSKFYRGGIIRCFGDDYNRIKFTERKHVLTNKGDELLREVSIYRGGEYSHYKYFKRK